MASRSKKQRSITSRHIFIACLFVAWMGGIIWRLAYLQIAQHEKYTDRAARQRNERQNTAAVRGTIVDRNNIILATSVETKALIADLFQSKEEKEKKERKEQKHQQKETLETIKARITQFLAGPLRTNESALASKLNSPNPAPVLASRLDWETESLIRKIIEANNLKNVRFLNDATRHYPNGTLAAHVLGMINSEQKGVLGLERQLERWPASQEAAAPGQEKKTQDYLTGQSGQVRLVKDRQGHAFSLEEIKSGYPGSRVVTTLDAMLQHKVEEAITQAYQETQADSICAIVMDPATGEVLSLANAPTFDPRENVYQGEKEEAARRNHAIADLYETGSVMKMVTYAAVIEEGLARPDEKINCRGPYMNGRFAISDTHAYGDLTVAEALAKSSNVGTIRLSLRLPKEKFASYLTRFGFGSKTGIDLPFEREGVLPPVETWRHTSQPSISIGYGVSITAIQAVSAMAAIANGGVWVQPHLVKRIESADASGRILYEANPLTRQVISARTSEIIRPMLMGVVENGTARHAIQLANYTAAGKTGTAKKAAKGGYSNSAYYASFAGFVPATNPRFAIIVVLDNPKGAHQGGQVAAPVFNRIAQAALADYSVLPDAEPARFQPTPAQPRGTAGKQAAAAPAPMKVEPTPTPKPSGKPTATAAVSPTKAKTTPTPKPTPLLKLPVAKSTIRVEAATKPAPAKSSNAPNVTGRTLREVASLCSQAGLKLKAVGSGVAKSQRRVGDTLIVEFR